MVAFILNVSGTDWLFICECAVKKLHT